MFSSFVFSEIGSAFGSDVVGLLSKPVAMTVTLISSWKVSLMTAPKMMFASGSTASATMAAASLTSNRLRSEPPVMLRRIPFAPSMVVSRSGLLIAAWVASMARLSPLP